MSGYVIPYTNGTMLRAGIGPCVFIIGNIKPSYIIYNLFKIKIVLAISQGQHQQEIETAYVLKAPLIERSLSQN